MLATASWVYLDLEKTGCTFLRNVFQSIFPPESFLVSSKHSLMATQNLLPKIMTVRNPYDYYFSLWRYGLDGKGGVYERLSSFFPDLSTKIYGNKSLIAFSAFLDFVLNCPARYPRSSRLDWLPLGFDLYSARILSMIVPLAVARPSLKI